MPTCLILIQGLAVELRFFLCTLHCHHNKSERDTQNQGCCVFHHIPEPKYSQIGLEVGSASILQHTITGMFYAGIECCYVICDS